MISIQKRSKFTQQQSLFVIAEAKDGDATLHKGSDQPLIQQCIQIRQQRQPIVFQQAGEFLRRLFFFLIPWVEYVILGASHENDLLAFCVVMFFTV